MFGVNTMKKLSTALLMSSAFLLVSANANANWQWNVLLGASAGYADRSGDFDFQSSRGGNATTVNAVAQDHSDNGFIWGFLGGIQARCTPWLFGAELNVDLHDFDDTQGHAYSTVSGGSLASNARFERGTVVGLSARAGYEMAPYLLPYIRLGVETSKDDLTVNGLYSNGTTFGLADSNRSYRFLGGVGFEVPVPTMENLVFRLEYNYHSKGSSVDVSGLANDTATAVLASMKPKTHSGKASIVWNFM